MRCMAVWVCRRTFCCCGLGLLGGWLVWGEMMPGGKDRWRDEAVVGRGDVGLLRLARNELMGD